MPNFRRRRKKKAGHWNQHVVPLMIALVLLMVLVAISLLLNGSILDFRFSSKSQDRHRSFIPPDQRIRPYQEGDVVPDENLWSPLHPKVDTRQEKISRNSRFLIFQPPFEAAQGVGNLMNGLLAAHYLGIEFERTVCVSKSWKEFHLAFHDRCPSSLPPRTPQNTIWLLNFSKHPVNECDLKSRLEDSSEPVMYFIANTYPRWPPTTTTLFQFRFEDYYQPKSNLLKAIPWSQAPSTVVHLRQADTQNGDFRVGMDNETMAALGALLPHNNTYLVSNQVDLFAYFEANFGWSHPPWTGIRHSAIAKVQWNSKQLVPTSYSEQMLALWVDWWTLYQADSIYHTHSDFSSSAVRWSRNLKSYVIGGLDETTSSLILKPEWESAANDMLPLSQRSEAQLQHCDLPALSSVGAAYDLDDALHDDLTDDWKKNMPVK